MVSVCLLIYIFPFLIDMPPSPLLGPSRRCPMNYDAIHLLPIESRPDFLVVCFILGLLVVLCVFLTFSSTSIFSPE